jgi:hypothetical protein
MSEPPAKKKCMGADCENEAGSLQCPTCLKLGIKDSFFCSQDCFKKNWVCVHAGNVKGFTADNPVGHSQDHPQVAK